MEATNEFRHPVCPKNSIGTRHHVTGTDGNMYEENFLFALLMTHTTPPVSRQLRNVVRMYNLNGKCSLNAEGGREEKYIRTDLNHRKTIA